MYSFPLCVILKFQQNTLTAIVEKPEEKTDTCKVFVKCLSSGSLCWDYHYLLTDECSTIIPITTTSDIQQALIPLKI